MFAVDNNYSCPDAVPISLGSETAIDNTQASPTQYVQCYKTYNIIWYKWQAIFSGYVQASTCFSANFTTLIAAYTSCAEFPSTDVPCATFQCQDREQILPHTALLNFAVTNGVTYYLAIGSYYSDETGTGTLKLSQNTMHLNLLTAAVPPTGGQLDFLLTTTAADNFKAYVYSSCTIIGTSYSAKYTSSDPQMRLFTSNQPQSCIAYGHAEHLLGLVSNAETFYIAYEMTLDLPAAGSTLVLNRPFSIQTSIGDGSIQVPTIANITCAGGHQLIQLTSNEVKTDAVLTNPALFGDCKMMAVTDPVEYATHNFTAVKIVYPLVLSVATATPTAGTSLSYHVSFSPPLPDEEVTIKLQCSIGGEVQSFTTTVSSSAQSFVVHSNAIGQCTLQAFPSNPDYPDSNAVSLTVYQQLYIASSLQGWTAGETVSVNVATANLESFSTSLLTTCSIGYFQQDINTNDVSSFTIPPGVNGISCLLSTPSVPQNYHPLQPTYVNIGLSDSDTRRIIQSLAPLNFVNSVMAGLINQFNDLRKWFLRGQGQ